MLLTYKGEHPREVEVTKETKKYIYFQTNPKNMSPVKYRYNKATDEVQVAPYYNVIEGLQIKEN